MLKECAPHQALARHQVLVRKFASLVEILGFAEALEMFWEVEPSASAYTNHFGHGILDSETVVACRIPLLERHVVRVCYST